MKSAVAIIIQLSIVAAVVVGVLFILRIGEERASDLAPAATEEVDQAQPTESADPASESAPAAEKTESVVKEEHAPPELS